MSSQIYEILFNEWKNKCDRCLSQPTIENIKDLREFIESEQCSPEFLQPLNSYCLYPFRILIEQLPSISKNQSIQPFSTENFLKQIFQTLCVIFKKICFTNKDLFEEFLTILTFFIDEDVVSNQPNSSFNYPPKIINICDDLYICLFECLYILLQSHDQYKTWFQSGQLKFKLGYLINSSLKLVNGNNSIKVKLKALDAVSIVIDRLIPDRFSKQSNSTIFEDYFGEINFIAFTLPRIVSTISKVFILYPDSENNLSCNALKLFSRILTIIYNWSQSFDNNKSGQDDSENLTVQFNDIWFDETCQRLTPIFNNIVKYFLNNGNYTKFNDHILYKFYFDLINHCCDQFILKFFKILIKIPLYLIAQQRSNESKLNDKALFCFESIQFENSSIILSNLIQEAFFEHIQALPYLVRNIDYNSLIANNKLVNRQILTQNDSQLALQIFSGFIIVFSKKFSLYEFVKLEQHNYQLFRTLVNLSEFDFKATLPFKLAEFEHFDNKFIAAEGNLLNESNKELTSNDLLTYFEMENHLLYLNDRKLFRMFSTTVRLLTHSPTNGSDIIIIEHMIELLKQSEFEPSVLLVMNLLMEGFLGRQSISYMNSYTSQLIDLYLNHLNNTDLHIVEEIDIKRSKQLEPILLSNLMSICSVPNETVIDHQTDFNGKNNEIKVCLHKQIIRHCLILHGLALICSRQEVNCKNEFYQKCFCRFLESYASNYKFISTIAKNSLIFIGQNIIVNIPETIVDHRHLFYIYYMIDYNFTYLYSSFTISLDYSVLHQVDNSTTAANDNELILYKYSYDHYSLKTVQLSLLTIFRLFINFHHSFENLNLKNFKYLNQLIDQILKIIKYYSIRSNPEKSSQNLNLLLRVLHSYLELLTQVYGHEDFQVNSDLNYKRITYDSIDISVDDLILNIEEYCKNLQFMNKQIDNLDGLDDGIIPEVIEKEEKDPDLEKNIRILNSPIINSRASQILYTCSLILSDKNIDIRLNVLELISMSMRLLRSFEDVLLPYVHKLWDPLVDRFSTDYDHPLILQRAFRCLLIASEFCGDFLLSRSRKDILPRLTNFLDVQLDCRRNFSSQNRLKSIEYYAESELLRSIGQLAVNLKLDSTDLWKIIPNLLLYLCLYNVESEQQKYAFESLITISTQLDSASVYFYLHKIFRLYYPSSSKLLNLERFEFECCCNTNINRDLNLRIANLSKYFRKIEDTLMNDLLDHLSHT